MLRLEHLRIAGQNHATASNRHPHHADENPHDRILSLSGSKGGVEPTMSTVAGSSSVMYSTASCSPSFACSGGRYDITMCLPIDGPAPADVTYERRPCASVSGVPSRSVTGSRCRGYSPRPVDVVLRAVGI